MSSSQTTATTKVRVKNENGLHARPSALIAQLAKRFLSRVEISSPEASVNAESVMGLITLCAFQGTEIVIWAEGEDAEQAVEAIADLFNKSFEEVYQ